MELSILSALPGAGCRASGGGSCGGMGPSRGPGAPPGGPSLSLLQQSFGVKWAPGLGCEPQWPLDLLIYLMFNLKLSLVFSWWLFKCFGYHIVHIICTNTAI